MGLKHRLQRGQVKPCRSCRLVAMCWVVLAALAAVLARHVTLG